MLWCLQITVADSGGLSAPPSFYVGGDSLSALTLVLNIEKVTGAKLSVGALFGALTIERLAELIAGGDAESREPRMLAIQPRGSRPPFFCALAGPWCRGLAVRL